jgi:hypothetical protein
MRERALHAPRLVSLPDLPDVPNWLRFAISKGKYVVIAAIVMFVASRRSAPRTP